MFAGETWLDCPLLLHKLKTRFGIDRLMASSGGNMVHGTNPEEVRQETEGMQIMRILGKNMAWFLKCGEAGGKAGIALPEQETISFTNFIH